MIGIKRDVIINTQTQFLEGPNNRGKEFSFLMKTLFQFLKGFRKLHFAGPGISVFGSARTKPTDPFYQLAYEVGKRISEMGFSVITGGGPGIMEAANKGAFDNGGRSIGCTIKLPKEQVSNPFMTNVVNFDYFFVRKTLLIKYSYAFIVLPGGFGTLDELFEVLTLIQTHIIYNFPVVVMGTEFYKDLNELINRMVIEGTINKEELSLLLFTDNIDHATEHIEKYINTNYKLKPKFKRWWLLGE